MPSVREKPTSLWQHEQWLGVRFHSWNGTYHTPMRKRKQEKK